MGGRNSSDSGGGRPPLLDESLVSDMDAYRRFRHRICPIYGYELDAGRVFVLAEGVTPLFERIRRAVEAFCRWLE